MERKSYQVVEIWKKKKTQRLAVSHRVFLRIWYKEKIKIKIIRVLKKSSHYPFGTLALDDLRRGTYTYTHIFSINEITSEGKKKG